MPANNVAVYFIAFLIFLVLVLVGILFLARYKAKKEIKKEFFNNFVIYPNDSNAENIVNKKIAQKRCEIEDTVEEIVRYLSSIKPAEHSPYFSWLEYWISQNSKVEEKLNELEKLYSLAKRFKFQIGGFKN